jgi:arylsulfatase A-like enzyme
MNRIITSLLAAAAASVSLAARAADAPPRPNVVFILVDDLRWDALGCTGNRIARTPNIDRIAREGALFKNFFVSIPLCSPSRSSFLTGQYAHTTGITHNGNNAERSHQLVTFPRLLRDAGYETAYVGKWHMGNDDAPRPGFDRWVSFKGQGVYENPEINVDGKSARVNGYMTDILNGYAVDFVRRKHTKPFLLYFAHKAVHGPFTPAARHAELFAGAKLPVTPNHHDSLAGKPALQRAATISTPAAAGGKKRAPGAPEPLNGFTSRHEDVMLHQLRAMVAVDDGVGDLFQALADTKQLDNTLLIFSSDNGYFWGEHGLGDKRWAYEESIRDPLLMRYPRLIKAGTTLEPLVLNIDLAPTVLELGGAPIPKTIQGRSLVPLFKDPQAPWRASLLTEYFLERGFPRVPTWQAVRTDRWKYIHYTKLDGLDELYDLSADPYELKNLIQDPSSRSTLKRLQAELAKWLQATGAPPP